MIKLPNIKGVLGVGKAFMLANRPELLFGASIASTLGAVVSAGYAGYKSGQQVLQAELDLTDENLEAMKVNKLDVKEKIQLTWLNYLPAAGLTGAALGSTTGLHIVHVKEKKAIAAAALMAIEEVRSDAAEYKEKVLETVKGELTEKQGEKVDAALERDGLVDSDGIVEELYLVRDAKTGRDIWSNETRINEAVNMTNAWIAKHGDCDLNTFYSHAGFANTPEGDDWGWSGDFIELVWDTAHRDDGRPIRRFTFRTKPTPG